MRAMAIGQDRKPSDPPLGLATWVSRVLKAARSGAPALRNLITADVELNVACGSTKEFARGATIVSEWLAGRIAMAQHFEAQPPLIRGSRVIAQISFGVDQGYPAVWQLEAVLTPEGTAKELTLRMQGSA
jgi:hypothetical protein